MIAGPTLFIIDCYLDSEKNEINAKMLPQWKNNEQRMEVDSPRDPLRN